MERKASPAAPSAFSPSDMVGPSPVTSNGTDTTEIEDEDNGDNGDNDDGELQRPQQTQTQVAGSPASVGPVS
jgi:hypothetical protein